MTCTDGVYQFSNVVIYITPGSSASLKLSISGLETYGNTIDFV